MKKIIISLLILLVLAGLMVGLMFSFKICPPQGPWPTPPWCQEKNFVRNNFTIKTETLTLAQIKAVNMFDTWGRNYNFGMLENTRDNITNSFDRVKALGASEVYVHDFHRAVYQGKTDFSSTNYQIVDDVFLNDFRDEALTPADLNNLAKNAHDRGLKIGVKHNLTFVDMGKYLLSGLKGDIQKNTENDYAAFNKVHGEAWIKDYFSKWQDRLVARAKMYQSAGIDIMSITPTFMGPTFAGQEILANSLEKNLIKEIKKVFSGQIYAELSLYGVLDGRDGQENWSLYDYYKDADIKEARLYYFPEKYRLAGSPSEKNMEPVFNLIFNDLETFAAKNKIKLTLFFSPFSYDNAINNGLVEFYDARNENVINKKQNWQHQADAYQAMFKALAGRKEIERLNVGGFWWDDAMDPEIKPRVSLNGSPRNKIAEEIIKQWFNAR